MAYSESLSIVEELQEQVEYWRDRAESAERAIKGDKWNEAVPPMTLQETRIMRIIARRPVSGASILGTLYADYPNTSDNVLKSRLSMIRGKMPEHLSPTRFGGKMTPYNVPDRDALKAFLGEVEIEPEPSVKVAPVPHRKQWAVQQARIETLDGCVIVPAIPLDLARHIAALLAKHPGPIGGSPDLEDAA